MAASIFLPIMITNISLLLVSQKVIFGYYGPEQTSLKWLICQKICIVLLGPFTPALMLNNYEIESEKTDESSYRWSFFGRIREATKHCSLNQGETIKLQVIRTDNGGFHTTDNHVDHDPADLY